MAEPGRSLKPRILVLENSTAVTGALISILRSCQYLNDQFDFIFILPSKSKGIAFVRERGFPVIEVSLFELKRSFVSWIIYPPRLLVNVFRLKAICKSEKIDLIINNDFYNLTPPVYKLLGGSVAYVSYVRFRPSRFPAFLVNRWVALHQKYSEGVICVSETVRTELTQWNNLVVIGNELPDDEGFKEPSDSKLILFPSNYISGKGHGYALKCFATLSDRYPDWRLRFVGDDMSLLKNTAYKIALQKKALELGVSDKVEWKDFSLDIRNDYKESSIVLVFSESESFSMVCLEAMHYHRPVIATRCGGPEELIEDGVTGLLVLVNDIESMTQALEKLMTSSILREKLSTKARTFVHEKYSLSNTSYKLGALINHVIGRQKGNGSLLS